MDKLITFQNTEEVHRISPTDNHQVVYFNQTYALIETGIVVFRNGLYQVNEKDFFFLNRNGRKMTATDKFVIGVCFYQSGTTFQTLLQDNDYIVFKFAVLSPRVMDYDRITNTITEHYQRQIDGMADNIYGLQVQINQTNSNVTSLSSSTQASLEAHGTSIVGNATDIASIQGTLETINSTLSGIADDISGLTTDLGTLTSDLSSLTDRVSALEGYHTTSPVEENQGGEGGENSGEEPSNNEEPPANENPSEPEQEQEP